MKRFLLECLIGLVLLCTAVFIVLQSNEYRHMAETEEQLQSFSGYFLVHGDEIRYVDPVDLAIYSYVPSDMSSRQYLEALSDGIIPEELDMIPQKGEMLTNKKFVQRNSGRIFVDSQRNGSIWYVVPDAFFRVEIRADEDFVSQILPYARILNDDQESFLQSFQYN